MKKLLVALLGLVPLVSRAELSLQPSRALETVLEEGTWMQPDVSPDGRTILFDLLGDIYALDSSGGAAKPLLTGLPFESHPVFSPDGQHFAFVSDRSGVTNLWIADANGANPHRLSDEQDLTVFTSPAWSPDGKSVYISRMKHSVLAFELWRFDIASGEGVPIVKAQPNGESWDDRINALGAAPAPDGRFIYYSRKIGHTWTDKQPPNWSIARHDLTTHKDVVVIEGAGGAMHPALSHDGRSLVYASRSGAQTGLRLRKLETGEDRWLLIPIDHDGQEQGYYADLTPRFVFTPDDRSLLASVGGKLSRIDVATGGSTPVPFSAQVRVELGALTRVEQREETGAVRVRVNLTPRQSPDGKKLVFSALGTLYVQALRAGSKPRALRGAPRQAFQASWSPDGKALVYVTWDAMNGGHIWTIPSAGGTPKRLTQVAAFYTEPCYSPDGRTIAALRASHYDRLRAQTEISPDRATDLIQLPASGGEPSLIAHAFGARLIDFSGDGERLRFYGPEGASSIRLDGSDLRRELVVRARSPSQYVGAPIPVEELRLNPSGDRALVRTASQLYLVNVPAHDAPVPAAPTAAKRAREVATSAIGVSTSRAANAAASAARASASRVANAAASAARASASRATDAGVSAIRASAGAAAEALPAAAGTELHISTARKLTRIGADFFDWADGGKTIQWSVGASFRRISLAEADTSAESKAQKFDAVVEVPRDIPRSSLVLRGATVATMRGAEVIHDADVLVVNNRIKAIGEKGSVAIPKNTQIRDVSGKFIVPGFVDAHAHWFEIRRQIHDDQMWNLLANLAYGVTSGLDVQPFTTDVFAYQDMIDAGIMIGPHAWSTGPGVFTNSEITSKANTIDVLTRYRDYYRTRNIKSYMVGDRERRQYMIEASKELGMMPTTEGASDLVLNLTHAIDGFSGNEHALPVAPLREDVIRLFAQSRTSLVPTVSVLYGGEPALFNFIIQRQPQRDPKFTHFVPPGIVSEKLRNRHWMPQELETYSRFAADAMKIQQRGGVVGVGSHGEIQGLGFHWEMEVLASSGAPPIDVLRAATMGSAEAIGHAQDVGSLEPGKFADLLILDLDPLADIQNTQSLHWVMKNGRLYEAATLNEVWPRTRALPTLWFANSP